MISGRTRLYGLVGDPVAHSLSPRLANHAFAQLDLDAVYVAFRCGDCEPAALLSALSTLGVAGANVTYPLKTALVPHLAELSPTAAAVGAVNVLTPAGAGAGVWRGENTDAPGVALALEAWGSGAAMGRRVAILGGGAAARAAAHGVLNAGATQVTFCVRQPAERRAELESLGPIAPEATIGVVGLGGDEAAAVLRTVELVVQATPVGLVDPSARPLIQPDEAPQASGFELNYGRRPTAFATAWRAAGRACLDGRHLLVAQAQRALAIWCGQAPPLDELWSAIDDASGGEG